MTMEEFGDLVGKVVAYAIGIPLVVVSLLVAYWLVVTILRTAGPDRLAARGVDQESANSTLTPE